MFLNCEGDFCQDVSRGCSLLALKIIKFLEFWFAALRGRALKPLDSGAQGRARKVRGRRAEGITKDVGKTGRPIGHVRKIFEKLKENECGRIAEGFTTAVRKDRGRAPKPL